MIRQFTSSVAVSAIVLLAVIDVALLHQNRSLKQKLAVLQSSLEPGAALPPLRGINLQGEAEELRYGKDSRDTLMLVFSPQCGWCQRNMANWAALLRNVEKNKYRAVAVSITRDGAAEYARSHEWAGFPVFIEPDPRAAAAYRLRVTPQTILIDSEGVVRRLWLGAFDPRQEKEIEETFGVELPGLTNAVRPL